jgi:DNA-binding CsgD family transcriptional regulator
MHSARTLDLIQSKEVINKLITSVESGNVTPDSLSTIADADVATMVSSGIHITRSARRIDGNVRKVSNTISNI